MLQLTDPKLLGTFPYQYQNLWSGESHLFVQRCRNKVGLVLKEGQGWGWFSYEEALQLPFAERDKPGLEYLRNHPSLFENPLNPPCQGDRK